MTHDIIGGQAPRAAFIRMFGAAALALSMLLGLSAEASAQTVRLPHTEVVKQLGSQHDDNFVRSVARLAIPTDPDNPQESLVTITVTFLSKVIRNENGLNSYQHELNINSDSLENFRMLRKIGLNAQPASTVLSNLFKQIETGRQFQSAYLAVQDTGNASTESLHAQPILERTSLSIMNRLGKQLGRISISFFRPDTKNEI